MAGLLSDILGFIDRAKQSAKANVGLLVSDPREYFMSMEDQARENNRLGALAIQAERNAARGLPVTPEQAAAKQYVDQKTYDMAMGFAGSTKPNESILGYRGTTYGSMISNKPFTHFSKNPDVANQYAGWIDPKILTEVGIDLGNFPITQGAAVFPAKIKIKNPASIEDVRKFAPNATNVQESFEILKKQGFDGYIDDYQVVPFSKSQIESIFK